MSTKIAWATNPDGTRGETWNPVVGCSKVSPGCANCYAEKMARRLKGIGLPQYQEVVNEHGWTGEIALVPDALGKPLKWRKPRRVFVGSMTDLFHENVPLEYILRVFYQMGTADQHIYQVLTKRPVQAIEFFREWELAIEESKQYMAPFFEPPLRNVWLGVTAENQKAADERVPLLLQTPAAVRFVSVEPMLGPVDLSAWLGNFWLKSKREKRGGWWGHHGQPVDLHWIIIGCESGPGRRPMQLEWALDLARQCKAAGVACFVKQIEVNGKVSHDPNEWPEELRVREYPK